MEIKIAIAKTNKYAVSDSGDSVNFVERPHGGISLILADGQGSGKSAKATSSAVVNKAALLLGEGTRDGAAVRAVHDFLYALKNGKVSCTLTVMSADLETSTVVISRNSNCPVIVRTADYTEIYADEVNPLGVHRRTKPLMYELPLQEEMLLVSYTDGIAAAGRKHSTNVDIEQIIRIVEENSVEDVQYIADSILEYALDMDKNYPGDDMTVAVLGIQHKEIFHKIRRAQITYPY